jgi:chromosomal replication initiation ATPase DnaA
MQRNRARAADRERTQLVVLMVAWAFNMPPARVMDGSGKAERLARGIAVYVARTVYDMSLSRLAFAFGRDRSSIASACELIEDRRDDPAFDRWMEALERAAASMPSVTVNQASGQ